MKNKSNKVFNDSKKSEKSPSNEKSQYRGNNFSVEQNDKVAKSNGTSFSTKK